VSEISGNPSGLDSTQATCYLLVGASEGKLNLRARLRDGTLDALQIEPEGEFGGLIWDAIAAALVGVPLQAAAIRERLEPFQRAGMIPSEISLAPLVSTLVKMGK
jgi:hypothetical protein